MAGKKAELEKPERPEQKEAADMHRMLVGVREQMEYMLREQFTAIESAVQDRLRERDARISAADAMIARLQQEAADREAEAQRQAEKMAKLRQLALETA